MTALAGRIFQMIGLLLLPIGLSIGLFRDEVQLTWFFSPAATR